jgi:hypothetical protein
MRGFIAHGWGSTFSAPGPFGLAASFVSARQRISVNHAAIIQKNRIVAASPQIETASHHLVERTLAITGQMMLAAIASNIIEDASL